LIIKLHSLSSKDSLRLELKPPYNQTVSPLVRWAQTDGSTPYTIPADNDIAGNYSIKMSAVMMPPSYSQISHYGALLHMNVHMTFL